MTSQCIKPYRFSKLNYYTNSIKESSCVHHICTSCIATVNYIQMHACAFIVMENKKPHHAAARFGMAVTIWQLITAGACNDGNITLACV